jgi:lipopolysaccharide export system permease protein
MGNFGEKYELVAMKAGGISVRRVMMPMAVVVVLLTGMAFYFANNVMPTAMLKYRMTLYDITRKKPAVNIRPGEYYKEFDGYVIRVGAKGRDGRTLQDVIIYDHTRGADETTVIVAKRGIMQASVDNRYLKFTLYDGYSYTEETSGNNFRSRPLTSIGFRQQSINFDISSFAFNKSVEENFKGSYQMMNINQLDTSIANLDKALVERIGQYRANMLSNLRAWNRYSTSDTLQHAAKAVSVDSLLYSLPGKERRSARLHARNAAISAQQDAKLYADMIASDREYINRHHIEWHRKFTLSVACLLLFLIGAPFGSIVRKGGLGLPLVASVGFFVFYYVVGMIAEKAVRESAIGPIGMWISSFVMLPIGLFLTLQATTDSSLFDAASWKRFFKRLFTSKQQ